MELDRNGLELLDEAQCLSLLRSVSLGRVGLSVGALPVVLPVRFALVDREIVIRTGEGSKLDAAWDGAIVAFEADDFDALSDWGWSVLVQGPARVVVAPPDLAGLVRPPAPLGSAGDAVVAISCDLVSGRRVRPWCTLPGQGRFFGHR